jgi:uncharacterized protein
MMRRAGAVAAQPSAPSFKRFRSSLGEHVLIVPHTRVFDLPGDLADDWDADPAASTRLALTLAEQSPGETALEDVVVPSAQSISLNVSSACNLSCGYCYADRGGFGGAQSTRMTAEVAIAAVDTLLAGADRRAPVTIGFLGGEPLLNRALVRQVVDHAERAGAALGLDVRFSMTSNGTLLSEADIAMMRTRRFALTVSVDGGGAVHDRQRPTARGRGSFAELAKRLAPLLADPGSAQVAARMTVQSDSMDLAVRFDAVLGIGFSEAGVSPLRVSSNGSELADEHWPGYLAELIALSRRELGRALAGGSIRLTNLAVALKRIHAGSASPYPCGAGGGYFSVAAEGKWYACHRAVGDAAYELGDSRGLDEKRRQDFLVERHVHSQTDCRGCWARYLCSGSCHQESRSRSAAGCDFIRDWLSFCLSAYCELSTRRPEYFGIDVTH